MRFRNHNGMWREVSATSRRFPRLRRSDAEDELRRQLEDEVGIDRRQGAYLLGPAGTDENGGDAWARRYPLQCKLGHRTADLARDSVVDWGALGWSVGPLNSKVLEFGHLTWISPLYS